MPTMNTFIALLKRDLLIAYRNRSEVLNPLMFFVLVTMLFPLGIGPSPNLLQNIAPGVVWVAALLSALLSLDSLFRSDYDDGSLEQLVLSPRPLAIIVVARVLAHWVMSALPLLLLSPIMATALNLPVKALGTLLATLVLGTPVLSFIGAIGVALTLGLKRSGMLLALLVIPLYIPILIFGAGAVDIAAAGLPVTGQIYILAALLILSATLAPMAIAAALKMSVSQ
ncbi:MAG TPA: heme exporter protein CcmB [Gammaproteobacteria bacterium]|nr:heme exporter protein CcmB [Gammaproteobacteria bacterium]